MVFHTNMSDWKKSFIEAEQEKAETELQHVEPIKLRVGLYVTVCLFIAGGILIVSAIGGFFSLKSGWWLVCAGGCVGVEMVVAGGVVTWSGRGLSNTALVQGYLVLGVLSVVSCILQMTLLGLLAAVTPTFEATPALPPTASHERMRAWVQFLGGAQGAMAVLVGGMVGVTIVVTACCCKTPKDNVVGVYQPR
ncbi:uncharacterized protein LOC121872981 [Homarus americanus]|uniref:uncharacterized protein LOC121872981 n=1 Tax=Homarus americanus TaxID=6706 RepID=UPI001C44AF0B|nr:uncharacterized protein LOC121872981 [Homarus americanus]